ncbi:urea ABC transporter permease subunit UrtB [Alteromonas sp. KS69]|jgi:urea transport system permease protein|uniref:urea ABC transporter permease subunit UrtB n=1 Tax=unclassified Alteromonas TaxID=2614992 RepID=UPI000F85FDE4|nr:MULTISPECIES: urea ABC transporter permease subunit UrtB [unclassified Alteromonas]MBO7921104.1 urea ABC transporter permease subunit UrtB [Alteromonas sp. K632G]RUP82374.1 urea ABC transporter permease subunit UrtB [Alteromonas sp. KS69]
MFKSVLALFFVIIHLSIFQSARAQDVAFDDIVKALPEASFRTLPATLDKAATLDDERVATLLARLLEGDVYFHPKTQQVMYATKTQGERAWIDTLTEKNIAESSGVRLRKVRVNNRVRSHIRQLLAQRNLSHRDDTVRLQASESLLADVDSISTKVILSRLEQEENADIIEVLTAITALKRLQNDDVTEQLGALETLRGNLYPEVRVALLSLQRDSEVADTVKANVDAVLAGIEVKRKWFGWAETAFFGISMGSVLLLAAIGLSITFGVMGVINMAHGEMIMLGAYTTYVIQQTFPNLIEYSLLMAVPAAFLVSGLMGVLIERSVIQFLKGRPLETLLATFGISLILQQLVRTVFSPLNRQVASPEWMSGSWQINPVFSVTFNRLYIIIFSLAVFFSLLLFLKKSSLGLHVRAVAQNREMARALSVKSNWVDAATFGLGSGIAGVAGVVLSQLTNVGPNLGQAYIIDSFLVVVFGGVANLWGTLVSAMTLGVLNKFLEPVTGPVLATIIVLVGLVLFIQKRPMGLFPQKGRAE